MLILRIYLTLTYFYVIIVLKIRNLKIFAILEKRAMKGIGVLKEIDRLGRIVIPKELRDRYFLESEVEIIATTDGILIKNPEYSLVKIDKPKRD